MNTREVQILTTKALFAGVLLIALTMIVPALHADAAVVMEDYCLVPPYVKRDIKPNVLILMDNSREMGGPAYCTKDPDDPAICTDNYDPARVYDGYYEVPRNETGSREQYYCYDGMQWSPKPYSTTAPAGCITPAVYNGNLLNWAVTSKYDLLQRILVGGISASRQTNVNTLVSNTTNWTKTLVYRDSNGIDRSCRFIITAGSVEIADTVPNSCGYLDSPPLPIVASLEPEAKYASSDEARVVKGGRRSVLVPVPSPDQIAVEDAAVREQIRSVGYLKKILGYFALALDFLTPSAEAAKPITINVGQPPNGTECIAYSSGTAIGATGGTAPYAWSVTAGALPPGLTLTSGTPTAIISGSPTAAGPYSFTLRVTDAAGGADTKAYSMTIANNTVTITTNSPLQEGYVGSFYMVQLHASGACGNFAWSLDPTSPALPAGFSFSDSGDVGVLLNGTPTLQGTFAFVARVTDSSANVASKTFTFTIGPPLLTLTIASGSPLTSAMQYEPYFVYIESAGGSAPSTDPHYTWSITNGSSCANNHLPAGLTFSTITKGYYSSITGTPTESGTFCFMITVTDDNTGISASKEFSFTVTPQPAPIRRLSNLSLRVCAGIHLSSDPADIANCRGFGDAGIDTYDERLAQYSSGHPDLNGYPCSETYPNECKMKSGIIDDFWSRARYGLQDFNKVAGRAVPNLARCIVESPGTVPNEDFLTNIENAVPIDPTTTLVNAVYQAVNYYATNTDEDCDPFRQSTACLKNFILVLSSGVGADNPPHPSGGAASVYSDATNCGVATYENLTKNSCYGFNNDLRPALWGRQYVSTYIVNTMGALRSDDDPDNPVATTGDILHQAAARGGGEYYESTNANELRPLLIQAFQDILRRAAAGTAASVLASGEGSGANLVQAVFYPRRKFGNTEISWIGRLSNFWYYIDPFFDKSAIRTDDGDHILNVKTDGSHHDYITEMYYDAATETTRGRRWQDTNGDSLKDAQLSPDIEFEGLQTIWEAGSLLWQRNLATSPRMIKTSLGSGLMDFSIAGSGNLRPYLNVATDDEAEAIIRYVHGEDDPTVTSGTTYFYRNRTVSIDVNGNGTIDSGETNVWKLGDVLNSTPKLSSWIPLQQFNRTYRDDTYGNKPLNTGYIYSANYTSRGTIFAGANDGMLHAFKLGTLDDNWVGQGGTEKARITGTGLGSEMWAYIPRSVLPYLKYLKENNYCHIYSVDLTPYIFDASTKRDASVAQPAGCSDSTYWNCTKTQNSWRTIVIGGMRFGGACRETASTCSDCVKAPVADPADAARRSLGYSSYFAIDVTDQNNPQLLWEWDGTVLNASTGKYENRLGFTTTGPAVVKIKARKLRVDGAASEPDNDKNGRWFVVMGSGPTGPISTTDQQFMGRSDQNLRLFIMDLQLGPAALYEIDTGIPYAFAGSLLNANDDVDLDYQDDAVYIPYVRREVPLVGSPTWTKGGVVRLLTKEDMDGTNLSSTGTTALNPSNWTASTVMEDIGPVTSSVARLHNMVKHQHWVYVGEGRYYFEQGANTDDATNQRKIIGFKDPCFTLSGFDYACTTTRSVGDLVNVTNIADVPSNPDASGYNGWYINMDAAGNYAYDEDGTMITRAYRAERVITDPLATTSGVAFFTTYKPYNDECAFGGKSFIWAVKYDTGGAPGDNLRGKGLVQVSTGSIEQVDLSSAFTEGGGRKTGAMEGVPPTSSGLSILSTPPPVKRIMHIRER